MPETFAQPDDVGPLRASELHGSLSERLGAQAGEAFMGGLRTLTRIRQYGEAERGEETLGSQIERIQSGADINELIDQPRPAPDVPMSDAKARVKQEGLDAHLKLPEQATIKQGVLDLMIDHAHERRQLEAAVSRGPQGLLPDALGFVTEMGVGIIDPVNVAAFSIPVVGEARLGMMMARAGESMLSRAGVRAGVGTAQGALGGAALAPADWWLHTKDGQDYTYTDALRSIVLSAGMGAAFHAGFGALGDVRARRRGLALPGSPEDLVTRGLAHGTHVHAGALAAEGVPLEEVPGITPPAAAPRGGGVTLADRLRERMGLGEDVPPARQAIWSNKDHDVPVEMLDGLEVGADGRKYQRVRYGGVDSYVPADELRGAPPPHPAEVLADLPPRVQEDVVRASIADVINGNAVRSGELLEEAAKAEPRIAETIEAWHGSPHDFDRFDGSKIDTGQGAQSYGHGLYFAENEVVARGYSKSTPLADFIRKARELYAEFDSPGDAHAAVAESKEFSAAQKRLLAALEKDDWLGFDYPHQAVAAAVREPKAFDLSDETMAALRGLGTLYKVHINANREHFLDWDKPLNAQSPHVMSALERFKELATKEKQSEGNAHPPQSALMIGSDVGIDDFRRQLHYDFDQITAARLLNEAGLPGIKYLDQGSRHVDVDRARARLAEVRDEIANATARWGSQAEMRVAQFEKEAAALEDAIARGSNPTHNFVVFDDKLIEITDKNGKPVERRALQQAQPVMTGRGEVDQALRDPYVARAIAEPVIVRDKDVPYGAGANNAQDGVTNIDRHVPARDSVNGVDYDPAIPAAIHEQVEKHVMEAMIAKAEAARGRKLTDKETETIYEAAHHRFAEVAERAWVEAHLGEGAWEQYQAHWAKWLEPIEHENPKSPPADLYAKPYPHDDVHLAPRTRDSEFAGGRDREIGTGAGDARAGLKPAPTGGEGGAPGADNVVRVRPPAARGPRARPEESWSLLEFLAERGGIDPADPLIGDVRSSIGTGNKFVPGFGRLIRKGGMRLDRAREAAVEAGYLQDAGRQSGSLNETTVRSLLDAIDGELRGNRVYRQGHEPPAKAPERGQLEHEANGALDSALEGVEIKPKTVSGPLRERVVEIMLKEHVADPVEAYERAVLEETQHGAEAGQHQRIAETIPGWDLDDGRAAPGAGGAAEAGGERGAGGAPRQPGEAAGGANWKRVADARRSDDADLVAASNEAKAAEEPQSTDPQKAPSAAEQAAADADKLLNDILPRLSDAERAIFEDKLNELAADRTAQEQMVREGVACLLEAVA